MPGFLNIRTYISTVAKALVETIDLAYRYRYPKAATLLELKGMPTLGMPDRALRYVSEQGVCYRYHLYSKEPENLPAVVQPNDQPTNGRWIQTNSNVNFGPNLFRPLHREKTGYAKAVQWYQGESVEMLERIYAQRPAFLILFVEDDFTVKSTVQGGLYDVNLLFIITALSTQLRPEQQALSGSEIESETDPGITQMIGDIRYLLAGSDLGLGPGVKYCDIQGKAKITDQDLAQRSFEAEIPVLVRASVHRADEDLIPIQELWVQPQLASMTQLNDKNNYLRSGYRFSVPQGLTATPTPGIAYINGVLVASSPGAHLFPAMSDTYRDLLPNGTLLYSSVNINDREPPIPTGALRIGMTRTDNVNITYDSILCESIEDFSDPFLITP